MDYKHAIADQNKRALVIAQKKRHTQRDVFAVRAITRERVRTLREIERNVSVTIPKPLISISGSRVEFKTYDEMFGFLAGIMYGGE